jgi:hypothetical protein
VALTVNLPAYHLGVGDTGTVVDTISNGQAYVVEVSAGQIRRIEQGEIANARYIERMV